MMLLVTSHDTIKYHVRVNCGHEERLELVHVELRVHVARTSTCTMLLGLPEHESLAEEVRPEAPLDDFRCLLLKLIDEAVVNRFQGRTLLHNARCDLSLNVFQRSLILRRDPSLFMEMWLIFVHWRLQWVDGIGRRLKGHAIACTAIPGIVGV